MFAARGLAVSFAVFALVYTLLSLAVSLAWRKIWLYSQRNAVRWTADLLLVIRLFPLGVAIIVTTAFTVPSFLLLEPRTIDEPIGGFPLVLGICCAVLGIFGVVNSGVAMWQASRTISAWTRGAQLVGSCGSVPVLRLSRVAPAMTVAGIVRPKVLLSRVAESVLTGGELRTAMNHEIAHVRRRDNLRKLLLRSVAFPGMAALESAWLESTEMAADDAAVSNAAEALDLASALIKLSRLGPLEPSPELTAALVHDPASAVNARVERLLAWSCERRVTSGKYSLWYGLTAILVIVGPLVLAYSPLLIGMHAATEWLVQ